MNTDQIVNVTLLIAGLIILILWASENPAGGGGSYESRDYYQPADNEQYMPKW